MDRPDLSVLHDKFRNNVARFPGILKLLSEDLGVSTESLDSLETGFYPGNQSWIFPERDATGKVIGLMCRFLDGKKLMIPESKRGLIYEVNYEKENYEKKNWVRVSKENPCSLCGKADGCMYPNGEYTSPAAIVCVHISEGSVRALSDNAPGYLHILDKQKNARRCNSTSLSLSEFPILIVEGASDVAAAKDLGFTAVGRPSAEGGMQLVRELLAGYSAVIVGENDSGAGLKGMESAFQVLKPVCKSVVKIIPPTGIKDLRDWKNRHELTKDVLLEYIERCGVSTGDPNIFENDVASTIAKMWIIQEKTKDGTIIIRNYKGQWAEFDGQCYVTVDTDMFRGQIYKFLNGKSYYDKAKDGNITIKPYEPTRARLNDIIDALNQWCPIIDDPPLWLCKTSKPEPTDLIIFKNGMLDINKYIEGKIVLYPPTPELFTFDALPYNFDENLESVVWEKFLQEIYNGEAEKILLLSQWFGYNCVPDMSFEKLMLLTGRPRSGKSTVLETFQAMLGERQCCETSFQSLTGSFGYQPLLGKLAVMIGDAKSPKTGEANAVLEKILHITGGDAVSVNRKGLREIPSVHLKCRFTIAMNDLPAFTDHSRALEPRLNILTFENSYIGKEDRTLKRRLRQEASEGKIINFALRGLKDLRTRKDFIVPESSQKALEQFRDIASPVVSFVNECCETGPECYVAKDQLFDIWKSWCMSQGRQHGFKESFCRWFLATCPQVDTARIRIGINRTYIFRGIKISDEAFKEYFGG